MLSQDKWSLLGDAFPPTLATNAPEVTLKPNETPNATGLSVTSEGYIAAGTIPTGTTRVAKTYVIGSTTYNWYYNRLWLASSGNLVVGAPDYTAIYYKQKQGGIDFPDDTSNIIVFHPVGQTGLLVFKSTGAYLIPNANDRAGGFLSNGTTEFIQEAKISTAGHSVELDGVVYFCNTSGVYSVDGNGIVKEISFPIRGTITPAAITADYRNKLLVIGATHCYDVNNKRWFKYSGSTFVYESPRIRQDDGSPLTVDRVAFEVLFASGTAEDTLANIAFQTKIEDREWSTEQTIDVPYTRASQVFADADLQEADTGRDFKLRINSMSSSLSVKRILIRSDRMSAESRPS